MLEMSGLELASYLIEQDDELMCIFVTGYNQKNNKTPFQAS